MSFFRRILKYSGLFMLSGWMFFIGLLVGRGSAPVEFDTGWFQERLAVLFENSETKEPFLEKPELDFYAALQKSDLKEDYDLKLRKYPDSEDKNNTVSSLIPENLSTDVGLDNIQTPLKKSRKAMTFKIAGKQISLDNQQQSGKDNQQQSGKLLAKSDETKASAESAGTKTYGQSEEIKTTAKSEKTKIISQLLETKPVSQLPETKSEEVKEYSGKVYSYTIQIASFNSEADAMNHIAKLGAKGYSAYKSSGKVGDKTWYRIRTGSFNNITEAKETLKKLESSGIKGLIIQKD